jgi:hypothetical protein
VNDSLFSTGQGSCGLVSTRKTNVILATAQPDDVDWSVLSFHKRKLAVVAMGF